MAYGNQWLKSDLMNDAVNRFIQEMGAVYAEEGDRDVSPILFKADDESAGMLFELTLPKGEPHPYWRVRERQMTTDEISALAVMKAEYGRGFGREEWGIGTEIGSSFRIRGYVYNARQRNAWNVSVDREL
jgi:hypothetical protein